MILSAPANVDWTEIRLQCTKPSPSSKAHDRPSRPAICLTVSTVRDHGHDARDATVRCPKCDAKAPIQQPPPIRVTPRPPSAPTVHDLQLNVTLPASDYEAYLHPCVMLMPVVVGLAFLPLAFMIQGASDRNDKTPFWIITCIGMVTGAIFFLAALFRWRTERFIISSDRITRKWFLGTKEIYLRQIESIQVSRTLVGLMFITEQ